MMADLGLSTTDTSQAVSFLTEQGFAPISASLDDVNLAFGKFGEQLGLTEDEIIAIRNPLMATGNAFYDAEGNMKSMTEIAALLEGALGDLSEEQKNNALNTLFGVDASRAAIGLMESGEVVYTDIAKAAAELGVSQDVLNQYIEGGITQFEALQAQMSQVSAADAVSARMNTMSGQMEILQGTVETVGIKIGQALLPSFKDLVSNIQSFVDQHGDELIAMFESFATWVGDNLPVALDAAANAWNTNLKPAFDGFMSILSDLIPEIVSFVTEHAEAFKGALIAIGVVLAAGAIIGGILTLTATIAALANPITAIVVGVALLGAAWSENWFGIRDVTANVWDNFLKPAFEKMKEWFDVILPVALQVFDEWVKLNSDNLQFLASIWEDYLKPALETVWSFIQTSVIPIFEELFSWFSDTGPGAIQSTSDFLNTTLFPALEAIQAFIQDSVIVGLEALKQYLQENLPIAIQKLSDFWTNTLQPALNDVWTFIQESLIPTFQVVATWLEETISNAIITLTDYWNTSLLPAITAIWAFINDPLVPLFQTLAELLEVTVSTAIRLLTEAWELVLLPAITKVWDFIVASLQPVFIALQEFFDGPMKSALDAMARIWRDDIQPILQKVWDVIANFLQPALKVIQEFIQDKVIGTIEDITDDFDDFYDSLDAINTIVQNVIGYFRELIKALEDLHIPTDMLPGSPSPFEIALRGIASAASEVNSEMSGLNSTLGKTGSLSLTSGGLGQNESGNRSTVNNYTMNINSNSPKEPLIQDFQLMKSRMARV